MCAVIGAKISKPQREDFVFLRQIFIESKIRGLHATGLSYIHNGMIKTISRPVSADVFFNDFDLSEITNEDGDVNMIGHCRYSTSDLEYNQPIQIDDKLSVVHNGVITQSAPEDWPYIAKTKNDTELINLAIKNNENPLDKYPNASMAVIELHACGKLNYYRNGKRPLYRTQLKNGTLITSTKDIVLRADKRLNPERLNNQSEANELQP